LRQVVIRVAASVAMPRVKIKTIALLGAALPLAALAATPSAASSAAGGHAAGGRTVVLKDIAFTPARLRVSRGASVTFRFDDGTTIHNVRSRGRLKFRGSANKSQGTFKATLRKPGTYRYVCTLHPGMAGQITVR
jgi:plastocyanin